MDIDKNFNALTDELVHRGARRVLIQLPEGLKMNTVKLVEFLAARGIDALVHNDASYGACDLADGNARALGCDMLVHIGHNKFYRDFGVAVPVLYFPWMIDVCMDMDFSVIDEKKIGLVTNVQHLHLLDDVKKNLDKMEKTAVIGGQILGCWTANAVKIENDVDAFLFVGTGVFHSLALRTDKPVYGLDFERNKIERLDMSRLEKIRWGRIMKARDARSFGILVSSKAGQFQLLGSADRIKKRLEERDKKAVVLVMDEIRDEKLMGVDVDAFINTACPRILDDTWQKPIINASDVEKLLEDD